MARCVLLFRFLDLRLLGLVQALCCLCLLRCASSCCRFMKTDMAFGLTSGCPAVETWTEGGLHGCRRHAGKSTPGTSSCKAAGVYSAELSVGDPRRGEGFATGLGSTRGDPFVEDDVAEMWRDPKTDCRRRSRTLSWTRESREGTGSSTIPASMLPESGRGLRIVAVAGLKDHSRDGLP